MHVPPPHPLSWSVCISIYILYLFVCSLTINLMIIYLYMFSYLLSCLGGVFKLELFLPEEYPMAAPKVLLTWWHFVFNLIMLHIMGIVLQCGNISLRGILLYLVFVI